ncbi:MAG: hypothetical protein JW850_11660 [Thermoflexales bacterium]|nr:hypothetical protein [Thermoflexales bacterium]
MSTFNIETDIYITPQGELVVADLPAELQAALEAVGVRLDQPDLTGLLPHQGQAAASQAIQGSIH